MLKAEIKKLESSKGVKSSLSVGNRKAALSQVGGVDPEEFIKMQSKVAMLNNNVKCLEIEIDNKEEKIQSLLKNCIGAPDERLEILEKENFTLKQEMKGFGMTEKKARTKDESERMLKDITK